MKVVLIRPPKIQGALERSMVQHPVNLLYLAAVLREHGGNFEPEIWDFEVEKFSEEIVREKVRERKPSLVGITGMTCNIKVADRIMGWINDEDSEIVTVVGGPHCSSIPERTLQEFNNFDLAVIGEGEQTLLEICQKLHAGQDWEGIAGTAWRKGSEIVRESARAPIPDLDWLPNPARDLINHSLYRGASTPGLDATRHKTTELFTSRGCPEQCIFCAAHLVFGGRVRFRSAEHIFLEVDECMDKWGYRHFTIDDDTFTYNPARLQKICAGFKDRAITWDCDTRVNAVTREMLKMMAESGCKKVALGVESGSQRVLNLNKKGITLAQSHRAFELCRKFGFRTHAYVMLAAPGESSETLKLTEKMLDELKPNTIHVSICTPLPATNLARDAAQSGLISVNDYADMDYYLQTTSSNTLPLALPGLSYPQVLAARRYIL